MPGEGMDFSSKNGLSQKEMYLAAVFIVSIVMMNVR